MKTLVATDPSLTVFKKKENKNDEDTSWSATSTKDKATYRKQSYINIEKDLQYKNYMSRINKYLSHSQRKKNLNFSTTK